MKQKLITSLLFFIAQLILYIILVINYKGKYVPGDLSDIDVSISFVAFSTGISLLWVLSNIIKSYEREKPDYFKEHDDHLGI